MELHRYVHLNMFVASHAEGVAAVISALERTFILIKRLQSFQSAMQFVSYAYLS